MAILIDATDRAEADRLLEQTYALRKRILVDRLHWELPSGDSPLEVDQFDDQPTTLHLASLGKDGAVHGTLRLTPSLAPNVTCDVLQEHFPLPLPRAADIGECSRLCVDLDLPIVDRQIARADLLLAGLEFAVQSGWTRLIGAVRQAMLFDFARCGMAVDMLSPLTRFGADVVPAAAFSLESGQADLDRARAVFRVDRAVLRRFRPRVARQMKIAA